MVWTVNLWYTDMSTDVAIKKPRVFSWAWFKAIGSALRYDKYDARDWAIDTLSSLRSYATAGIIAWFKMSAWPAVSTFAKALWAKVVALATAVWAVGREAI